MVSVSDLTPAQLNYYNQLNDKYKEYMLFLLNRGLPAGYTFPTNEVWVHGTCYASPANAQHITIRGPVSDSGHIDSIASQAAAERRAAAAAEDSISLSTQPATVQAGINNTGPQISTQKDPLLYPTAAGGVLEGQVIAAPGNAMNQITLDAYRASGGTTTSTYRDEYTSSENPGESALQEAARVAQETAQKLFAKVAAQAPPLQASLMPISSVEEPKKASLLPIEAAVVAGADVAAQIQTSVNQIDLTPGFNLGISDGSLFDNLLGGGETTFDFMGVTQKILTETYVKYADVSIPYLGTTIGDYRVGQFEQATQGITDTVNKITQDAKDSVQQTLSPLNPAPQLAQLTNGALPLILGAGILYLVMKKK